MPRVGGKDAAVDVELTLAVAGLEKFLVVDLETASPHHQFGGVGVCDQEIAAVVIARRIGIAREAQEPTIVRDWTLTRTTLRARGHKFRSVLKNLEPVSISQNPA